MFERYREDARRAIFFARWEAQQSGSAYIEPAHLLLSLTHDADCKANQLFGLSAYTENFRNLLGVPASAQPSTSVDFPLSNLGKRVLAYTAEEAERLASKPIGTEHLLLGLLRERKSDVPETLAKVGIDLRERQRVEWVSSVVKGFLPYPRPSASIRGRAVRRSRRFSPTFTSFTSFAFFAVKGFALAHRSLRGHLCRINPPQLAFAVIAHPD
jgi:hypothetical protein